MSRPNWAKFPVFGAMKPILIGGFSAAGAAGARTAVATSATRASTRCFFMFASSLLALPERRDGLGEPVHLLGIPGYGHDQERVDVQRRVLLDAGDGLGDPADDGARGGVEDEPPVIGLDVIGHCAGRAVAVGVEVPVHPGDRK